MSVQKCPGSLMAIAPMEVCAQRISVSAVVPALAAPIKNKLALAIVSNLC